MGNLCRSVCESKLEAEVDQKTVFDGFVLKKKEKDYIISVLEEKDKFSQYIDKTKFAYYFGVTLKLQAWLKKKWESVNLEKNRSSFEREKINEAVFPKLKYLIRKGVPLEKIKSYVQCVFGITNLNTTMRFNADYKLIADSLDHHLDNCPTFGQKAKLEKLLVHHALTKEGVHVASAH